MVHSLCRFCYAACRYGTADVALSHITFHLQSCWDFYRLYGALPIRTEDGKKQRKKKEHFLATGREDCLDGSKKRKGDGEERSETPNSNGQEDTSLDNNNSCSSSNNKFSAKKPRLAEEYGVDYAESEPSPSSSARTASVKLEDMEPATKKETSLGHSGRTMERTCQCEGCSNPQGSYDENWVLIESGVLEKAGKPDRVSLCGQIFCYACYDHFVNHSECEKSRAECGWSVARARFAMRNGEGKLNGEALSPLSEEGDAEPLNVCLRCSSAESTTLVIPCMCLVSCPRSIITSLHFAW